MKTLPDNNAHIVFDEKNPKRTGSKANERYELYKGAKTVSEAIKCGAQRSDIVNDFDKGYCKVLTPSDVDGSNSRKRADLAAAPLPAKAARPHVAEDVHKLESQPGTDIQSLVEEVPASSSCCSSQATPGMSKPRLDNVDLSFAKLEGKPIKFIKRVMGEAKRLLGNQGQADARQEGYHFELKDRDNLSKWSVNLRDLNPEGKLAKDLAKLKLDASIDLEVCLPDGFPLEPPFVRVTYPQLSGGYVFSHGGICFEPLTAKGWAPSMTLPNLAIAIKGILDYGEVCVVGAGNRASRTIPEYTEAGARKDHNQILQAHKGGDSRTYIAQMYVTS
jgi:ubiquitin-protein ligase